MFGGAGNDAYFVDDGGDVLIENSGEGTDAVFSTAHLRLSENVGTLVLQGGGTTLQGYGNSQANKLYGNTGSNLLDGGTGADVMRGDTGNDVYFVDDAGDLVFENLGAGTDAVFATVICVRCRFRRRGHPGLHRGARFAAVRRLRHGGRGSHVHVCPRPRQPVLAGPLRA